VNDDVYKEAELLKRTSIGSICSSNTITCML